MNSFNKYFSPGIIKLILFKNGKNSVGNNLIFISLIFSGILLTFGYESCLYHNCLPQSYCVKFIIFPLRIFWILNLIILSLNFYFRNLYTYLTMIPFSAFIILCRFFDPYFDTIEKFDVLAYGLLSLFYLFEKAYNQFSLILNLK
jgi:hypothetical protein